MKQEKLVTLIILCIYISGCVTFRTDELRPVVNNKNAVSIEIFNNRDNLQPGPINLSEFADSVAFIILEETDESLLSSQNINRVFFTSDYIIVVQNGHGAFGAIFFFDRNGKYVRQISRRGQGPGEYTSMWSVMFDEQNQQLIVYDMHPKRILFYDIYGNFIRDISNFSHGAVIRDITNLSNGHFLCYRFDALGGNVDQRFNGLWEVDGNGNFLRNYFMYDVQLPVMFPGVPVPAFQTLTNGTVNLKDHIHNDIYNINYHKGTVEKYISYEIRGNKYINLIGADVEMLRINRNITAWIVQEKGDYIITYWIDEERRLLFSLFSKKTKKIRFWDAFFSYDADIPGVIHLPVSSNSPNILVFTLDPDIIDDFLADSNLPESTRNQLSVLSQKVKGTENPILGLVYIK